MIARPLPLLALAMLAACSGASDKGAAPGDTGPDADDTADDTAVEGEELLDSYILASDTMFPEGVAFHEGERAFFVGSLSTGVITRIDADGTETEVFAPEEPDRMSLGMKISPHTDDLVVCATSDYGTEAVSSELWVLDPTTGTRTASIDLGAAFEGAICNDVGFDEDGRVYITDRESPNLYRVDLDAGAAELWLSDPLLEPEIIGLNGVVLTPEGELLVGKYAPGRLLRVPLDEPSALVEVPVGGDGLGSLPNGPDGMTWFEGDLVIAGNMQVFRLSSDDGWQTATSVATEPGVGIAAVTVAEGRVYGLKGEVVPFVLGTAVDLPFELRALEL